MKRKLALLIASAMVLSSVPAVSFAATTNRISNVVTGDDDRELADGTVDKDGNATATAPVLRMYEKDLNDTTSGEAISFQLDLTNAEWLDGIDGSSKDGKGKFDVELDDGTAIKGAQIIEGLDDVEVTRLSSRSIVIEGKVNHTKNADDDVQIAVNMFTRLTDSGDATVTIDPLDSVISSGSYKFATVAEGSTTTTVEKKKNVPEKGAVLKNVVIKETAPGSIEDGQMKFKLTSDWSYLNDGTSVADKAFEVSVYPSKYGFDGAECMFVKNNDGSYVSFDEDRQEAYLNVKAGFKSDTAITISIAAAVQYDDDEVEPGDIGEMTVSGAGVDKTTLEVGTAVTYGVTWEAEDKTVPTFYWGSADDDDDTLQVHFEEQVANSWLTDRKTKIVFPEEVRVLGVDIDNKKNIGSIDYTIDENEITIEGVKPDKADTVEADFTFQISVQPGFTGDITATIQEIGRAHV